MYNNASIYKGESIYKMGGGYDPTDNIFIYPVPDGVYTIDGVDYPYKKINNRYWTIKNLYVDLPTATKNPSGNPNTPSYWDCYGDADLRYIFGFQYNGYCVQIINSILTNGWRVPLENDFVDLNTGFDSNDLKSIKLWGLNLTAEKPTNRSFFNSVPAGQRADGTNNGLTAGAYYWSSTEEAGGTGRLLNMRIRDESSVVTYGYNAKSRSRSIIICKDA
jgi:uncharacterized protein (TIGR02145 family)